MSAANVLILSANNEFALNLLRCLRTPARRCHVMGAGALEAVRRSRFCEGYLESSLDEFRSPTDALLTKLDRYCDEHRIGSLIPGDIVGAFFLARIASRIPADRVFPIPEIAILHTLHDKWRFARFLEKHGLPHPSTMMIEERLISAPLFGFPLIAKPIDQGNSIGVRQIGSADALRQYLEDPSVRLPVLLQEFIPGKDFGFNLLSKNGKLLAWSIQEWLSRDTLRFVENEAVLALGRAIVEKAAYSGVANIDMRIDARDGRVKVIEYNPRFWGSLRASFWNGINFADAGLRLQRGEALPGLQNLGITYRLPKAVFSDLLHARLGRLMSVPAPTLQDVLQMFADPGALTAAVSHKIFRRKMS